MLNRILNGLIVAAMVACELSPKLETRVERNAAPEVAV